MGRPSSLPAGGAHRPLDRIRARRGAWSPSVRVGAVPATTRPPVRATPRNNPPPGGRPAGGMFGPELFLVRLSDDGMAPRLRAVDFAYVDPDEPAVDGCLVAVWDPAPRPRDAAGWAGTARSLRAAYPGFTASRAPWWLLTRLGRRTRRPRARQRARRMKRPGLRWDASPGRWDGSGGGRGAALGRMDPRVRTGGPERRDGVRESQTAALLRGSGRWRFVGRRT